MSSATSSTRSTTSPGGTRTGPRSASSTRSCWPTTGAVFWTASRGCPWVISPLKGSFSRRVTREYTVYQGWQRGPMGRQHVSS